MDRTDLLFELRRIATTKEKSNLDLRWKAATDSLFVFLADKEVEAAFNDATEPNPWWD